MTAASLSAHDALLPPRATAAGGRGALLSLLAHGGLVAALAWGVQWRIGEPQVLSAELWSSVPQQAAPPPAPAPAPPPPAPAPAPVAPKAAEPEAQIAIERAERQRREREERDAALREKARADKERRDRDARDAARAEAQKREQEQREAKAQDERLARQREENLRRMLGAAGAGSAPTAQAGAGPRDAAPSAAYAGRLRARIRPNIVFAEDVRGNPEAEVEVRCAPEGTIMARRIVKSSGVKAWDEAVLRAIDKTDRLPADADGRVPATLIIAFRPRE